MKNYNTRFAVRIEKDGVFDFIKDGSRICIFPMGEALKKKAEMKSMGYEVALMPYCKA